MQHNKIIQLKTLSLQFLCQHKYLIFEKWILLFFIFFHLVLGSFEVFYLLINFLNIFILPLQHLLHSYDL